MSETVVESRLIGALFVERGLITEEQLGKALELQESGGGRLGEIIVAEFGVSRVELASALAQQWAEVEQAARAEAPAPREGDDADASPAELVPTVPDIAHAAPRRPIGEIFIERGLVTEAQLEAALEEQRGSGGKLGEILVEQGVLSRLDLAGALADQWAGLQKLRPPDPKPIEPWQQVAPLELAAAPTTDEATNGAEQPLADLEERVRTAEMALASEQWREELRHAGDALSARLAAVEARLDGLSAHDDRAALESIHAEVLELREQLAAPEARLSAVEEQLAETVSPSLLDERIADASARLAERLGEVEAGTPSAAAVDALRADVAGLERVLADMSADRVGPEVVDALRSDLARAEERLAASAAAFTGRLDELTADRADAEAVEQLRADVERLGRLVDERVGDGRLQQRLDVLEQRVASASRRIDERVAEIGAAVPVLGDRIGALEARLTNLATADETADPAVVEQLADQLAALREQLTDARRRSDESDAERTAAVERLLARVDALAHHAALRSDIDAIRAEAATQSSLDDVASRVDALAASRESDVGADELQALREQLAELAEATVDDDLRAHISSLEERLNADSADRGAVESLRTELEAVRSLAEIGAGTQGTLSELMRWVDTLAERATASASRDELVQLADELRARIDEIEAAQPHPAEATPWADEVAALRAELRAVGPVEHAGPGADAESLRRRVDELAARVDAAATADDLERLASELRAGLHGTNDRIRGAAEAEERLLERVDAIEKRLASAVESRGEAASLVDELRHRLDALTERAPAPTSDLDALKTELAAIAAVAAGATEASREAGRTAIRAAETVDGLTSRLADVEATAAESAASHVSELTELRDRLTELADHARDSATRPELVGLAGDVRAQLAELAARLSAAVAAQTAAREEASVELSARLAALDESQRERQAAAAALDQRIDELAAGADANADAVATLRDQVAATALEGARRHEELAGALAEARADDRHAGHESALAELRELVARELTGAGGLVARLETLEKASSQRLDEVERTAAAAVADAAEIRAASDGVDARILELQSELAVELDDRGRRTHEKLAAHEGRVARELERATGSLAFRLEQVERSLAESRAAESDARLDALEEQLARGDALHEAHVRATEKALRKGLAALGERLVESEQDYISAGNTLRRSIERLGWAVAEADVRLGERDDPDAAERHAAAAATHVAFAPTEDGYRLRACDGPAPEVGAEVTLDGRSLRCTRVGPSPLPLDARPCAYLEPIPPDAE